MLDSIIEAIESKYKNKAALSQNRKNNSAHGPIIQKENDYFIHTASTGSTLSVFPNFEPIPVKYLIY